MKLSIIIPVYNVEDTLLRCVESIEKQDYSDYEIILVDDGSLDRSGSICDDLSEKNTSIKTIHKANGGLSDARNAGIDACSGEYITFIDSDDFIAEGTLTDVMNIIADNPNYDMLEYSAIIHYGSDKVYPLKLKSKTYNSLYDYWFDGNAYDHTYAWNKIFRKNLFNDVRFPVGKVFEDVYTLPLLLKNITTIATTEKGLYYYTLNLKGITVTAGGKELNDLLQAHLQFIRDMNCKNLNDSEYQRYYLHIINIQIDVYNMTGKSIELPSIKFTDYKSGHSFKSKLKIFIVNTLGINRLCRIFKLAYKIKKRLS
jgi:glycosyltransferase involved in cell wall biosynthesis